MSTQPVSKDHRKQKKAKIQRETVISPILAEKFKKEKGKDDCRILNSRRTSGTE